MIQYVVNKRTTISLPTSWREVTLGQAKAIITGPDDQGDNEIFMIATLTGLDIEYWRQFKDVAGFLKLVHVANDFISRPIEIENLEPVWEIKYAGKTYEMPKDLGFTEVGQYNDGLKLVRQMAGIENPTLLQIIGLYESLCKIFIQKQINGEYDYGDAMLMSLDSVHYVSIAKWGSFFLKMLNELKNGMQTNATVKDSTVKRRLRGIRTYLQNTVLIYRSGRWLKGISLQSKV